MSNQESVSPVPRVAVVGTGTMGAAMATRLLARHFNVDVWSRNLASTEPLVGLGASSHADVREAVAKADVVLSMLPTADITVEVMFKSRGLEAMQPNAAWVQMATIGASETQSIADLVVKRRADVTFIDAPVSGSRGPAESGQLLILASGEGSQAPMLASVFDVLGKKTIWLGPVGAGSRVKLILNTWLAFQIEGAAEAASLANRLNVEPATLLEALHDSPLVSPYAMGKLEKIIYRDFSPDFSLEWALKDLELVGTNAGADAAPIAAAIALRWRDLVNNGVGKLDVSAAGLGLDNSTDQTSS
jgi:3-hydroxyisobutyrate dehydrogenase